MNNIKTGTILLLAAALTAACDPFPKAPGGTPEVIRVVASGPTSEAKLDGPFADPTTDLVIDNAVLNDSFYVWFNKQMDGTTVQAGPDVSVVNGAVIKNAAACDPAGSPLTNNLPATARLCYTSGSAIAGGIIEIRPKAFPTLTSDQTAENYWDVGSYSFSGTVKDYQGIPLAIAATFNVTHMPVFIEPDSYTIDLGWARDPAATNYTIQILQNDGADPLPTDTWTTVTSTATWKPPVVALSGNNSIFRVTGLSPDAIYWFRVLPEGAVTANTVPAGIQMGSPPTPTARANPLDENGAKIPDTARVSVARIRGAAYRVEVTSDVTNDPPTGWAPAAGPLTLPDGTVKTNPVTGVTASPFIIDVGGLTNGNSYQVRFVPVFGGLDGTPTEASGPFTIAN